MAAWKALHGRILVDKTLQHHGNSLCSHCSLCLAAEESISHLLLECPWVEVVWLRLFNLFKVPRPSNMSLQFFFSDIFLNLLSPQLRVLWRMAICNLIWCLWTERNAIRYDSLQFCPRHFWQFFILSLKDSAALWFSPCYPPLHGDTSPVFQLLGLSPLRARAPKFTQMALSGTP